MPPAPGAMGLSARMRMVDLPRHLARGLVNGQSQEAPSAPLPGKGQSPVKSGPLKRAGEGEELRQQGIIEPSGPKILPKEVGIKEGLKNPIPSGYSTKRRDKEEGRDNLEEEVERDDGEGEGEDEDEEDIMTSLPARPGYCENCRVKFDNLEEHALTQRHRRFAIDDSYWSVVDDALKGLERPILIETPKRKRLPDSWLRWDETEGKDDIGHSGGSKRSRRALDSPNEDGSEVQEEGEEEPTTEEEEGSNEEEGSVTLVRTSPNYSRRLLGSC
ncbi:DBF zinc finger-domain-containing protein [Piptocephalis cylindrospora]|uniref:DBF zinc finger-domain-containing protein n=1 Tax=Piptocephalis cylindrospora TaxID=1907219 RepID=A0A4P9Y208_9FUNG|nr:DBF zinc finger-domain-containing protein [Piptocephalis cylindrospora]|eukprot:RKP11870.1 DBF zinc finger-domain-containing protein [Piptocephalis cylindrospora]